MSGFYCSFSSELQILLFVKKNYFYFFRKTTVLVISKDHDTIFFFKFFENDIHEVISISQAK